MRILIVMMLCLGGALGQSSPDLSLQDSTGKTYRISDYRGKIVVLNFWATWCTPCKEEMPLFTEAFKKYGQRGLVILAASVDDAKTKKFVPKFVQRFKMDFPVLLDATAETMEKLGLSDSVPSTLFFDEKGNVVDKIVGQARKKDLQAKIEKLLERQSASAASEGPPLGAR